MLVVKPDLTIEFSKHDDIKIAYCLDDNYQLKEGDKIIFQIRNRCGDIILTKVITAFENGVAYIHLTNKDTSKLDVRTYWYDIKAICPEISLSSTMISQREVIVKGGISNV